jgi:hypothetical protein
MKLVLTLTTFNFQLIMCTQVMHIMTSIKNMNQNTVNRQPQVTSTWQRVIRVMTVHAGTVCTLSTVEHIE